MHGGSVPCSFCCTTTRTTVLLAAPMTKCSATSFCDDDLNTTAATAAPLPPPPPPCSPTVGRPRFAMSTTTLAAALMMVHPTNREDEGSSEDQGGYKASVFVATISWRQAPLKDSRLYDLRVLLALMWRVSGFKLHEGPEIDVPASPAWRPLHRLRARAVGNFRETA